MDDFGNTAHDLRVRCTGCGEWNTLPPGTEAARAVCVQCSCPLFESEIFWSDEKGKAGHKNNKAVNWNWILIAAVSAFIAIGLFGIFSSDRPSNTTEVTNPPKSKTEPPQAEQPKPSKEFEAELKRENDKKRLIDCVQVQREETRMEPSNTIRAITGDLRPRWRISGRVENSCALRFEHVVFEVAVGTKDTPLDSGELTLEGTILPFETRGFVQEIPLRIDKSGWTWSIWPIRGEIQNVTSQQ
jgi:hypothetical protein